MYYRLISHRANMVVVTETGALDNELMYFWWKRFTWAFTSLAIQFSNALQNVGIGHVTAEV